MSVETHLAALVRRHGVLEQQIEEALTRPATDSLEVVEMKRRKLHLKDEITRLKARSVH